MAEKTKKDVMVMPLQGKFLQISVDGKGYDIFRVHPTFSVGKKNCFGTPVPYDVAVKLLMMQPILVAVVPEVKDGQFVQVFAEEDRVKISEVHSRATAGLPVYEAKAVEVPADTAALQELVKKQAAMLEGFSSQLKEASAVQEKLEIRIEELENIINDEPSEDELTEEQKDAGAAT
jgi:hypothetical protein